MDISPKTAMHTVTLNLMQLICGVMLSVAAGGGATYWTLTTIDVTCTVPVPTRRSRTSLSGSSSNRRTCCR